MHASQTLMLLEKAMCGLSASHPHLAWLFLTPTPRLAAALFLTPTPRLTAALPQGRMFVFDHYLCFYSNVFGYITKKVVPLSVSWGQHGAARVVTA